MQNLDRCFLTNGRSTTKLSLQSIEESSKNADVIVASGMPVLDALKYCTDRVTTQYFFKLDDDFFVHPMCFKFMEHRLSQIIELYNNRLGLFYCHLWDEANGIIQAIKIYNLEAIDKVGGFVQDEFGREDRPFNHKLLKAGYVLVGDESVVAIHAIGNENDVVGYTNLWTSMATIKDKPRKNPAQLQRTIDYAKSPHNLEGQYLLRIRFLELLNQTRNTDFGNWLKTPKIGDLL